MMKGLERFRMIRRAGYQSLFAARELSIAGLLIMPALLFNPDTYLRIGQFFLFWFFAWLTGKRNNPLATLSVILGITAFHLLIPYGRLLFSLGGFKITAGALLTGLHRGVTLEGLILLSRASVREDLRLPGGFGALLGESLRLFALITERKQILKGKGLIRGIDELMLELSDDTSGEAAAASAEAPVIPAPSSPGAGEGRRPEKKTPGRLLLLTAIILGWLPWVWVFRG